MTVTIRRGDAFAVLRTLPDDSVDMICTSPPYWGLRDYGVDGQIGLESSLFEHLQIMVELFREARRVLKPTGSLWLNYGDCYATAPNGRSAADTKAAGSDDRTFRDKPFSTVGGTLKPKDLCMLPNRLAIALQDDGWWVRSEIIWGKPNAMPDSSGRYRPSAAHEKIFLLTKSGDADVWVARDTGEISFSPDLGERCPLVTKPDKLGPRWTRLGSYYDASGVMMPVSKATHARLSQDVMSQIGSARANGGQKTNGNMKAVGSRRKKFDPGAGNRNNASFDVAMQLPPSERLLRNYEPDVTAIVPPAIVAWEIAIAGFSGAHFATFPPALVVPCIMAGCPVGGVVLDPFGGAGTTGLVADMLGRDAILIELNPEYAELAAERLRAAKVQVEGIARAARDAAGPLFAQAGEAA